MSNSVCASYHHDFRPIPYTGRKAMAMQKYAEAVKLYASSDLSIKEIAKECEVTVRGLCAHLNRYYRPLMFVRYGLDPDNSAGYALKIKSPRGQSLKTHLKYKKAIEACGDIAYIEFNVSQVAQLFDLDGPALASQLRVHYPEVIPNRERVRRELGIADNIHRGARFVSEETYREAVSMYRDTDLSIPEVADKCNVSKGGLSQYLRFYHHDVIAEKAKKRAASCMSSDYHKAGTLSGNGQLYGPGIKTMAHYGEALELYRNSDKTVPEISKETNVSYEGFRGYLSRWYPGEKLRRRGYEWDGESAPDLKGTRKFLKSTRGKYREAIESLKADPRPVTAVALQYNLNADVFREYLKTHEPDLAARLGMVKLADGRTVKRASYEKYRAAIEEYASSPDSLRNIADRHGIVYNSLSGFIIRNCPAERESHKLAVKNAMPDLA